MSSSEVSTKPTCHLHRPQLCQTGWLHSHMQSSLTAPQPGKRTHTQEHTHTKKKYTKVRVQNVLRAKRRCKEIKHRFHSYQNHSAAQHFIKLLLLTHSVRGLPLSKLFLHTIIKTVASLDTIDIKPNPKQSHKGTEAESSPYRESSQQCSSENMNTEIK